MEFINVRAANPEESAMHKSYPVRLDFSRTAGGDKRDFPLSIEEARELASELLTAAQEAEYAKTSFVQVSFPRTAQLYTYIDPSGELKVGDKVMVTSDFGQGFAATSGSSTARVVALGKGSYDGPFKSIRAKVVEL